MKTVKRIAAVLLAVMLMAPAAVHAAAPSVRDTNLNKKKATATVTYNKKTQLPTTITVNGHKYQCHKNSGVGKLPDPRFGSRKSRTGGCTRYKMGTRT